MRQLQELTSDDFKHKNVPEFNLATEEYSRVLDSVVMANVDIALYKPSGEVLLGRRVDKPLQGQLWIFGGRMKPGESINDTAKRNIKREVGVSIDEQRLFLSDVYNIMWPGRAEPPQEHGFQTMMSIMKYECNDEEAAQVKPADETHDHMRWYSKSELTELRDNELLHPYLITVLEDAGLL